jgi:hypothetical protein
MPMCRVVRAVGAVGISLLMAGSAAANDRKLTIYAPHWEGYTNPDGSGFGWAIVRAVFEPADVEIDIKTAPYTRSVKAVVDAHADAWLGAYLNDHPAAVYPAWHFDADRFSAVMREGDAANWAGKASLRGADVAWIPGYNIDKYLDVDMGSVRKIDSRRQAMRLLARGMLDYFLDATWEAENALNNLPSGLSRADFAVKHVKNIKLYPAFAPTPEGRSYQRIWDRRLPKLLYTDKLAALYDKHDLTLWPFDHRRAH